MPSKGWRKGMPRQPKQSGRHAKPRTRATGHTGASGWAKSAAKAAATAAAAASAAGGAAEEEGAAAAAAAASAAAEKEGVSTAFQSCL